MFSQLSASLVRSAFLVVRLRIAVARVVLMQLFRAIRAIEFVAFAGHAHECNGQKQ